MIGGGLDGPGCVVLSPLSLFFCISSSPHTPGWGKQGGKFVFQPQFPHTHTHTGRKIRLENHPQIQQVPPWIRYSLKRVAASLSGSSVRRLVDDSK